MASASRVKLSGPFEEFPTSIYDSAAVIEQLDLSGTGLSSLPDDFAAHFPHLRILFLSSCSFTTFPSQLAACPQLEMVAFRGNGITEIPENAFPARLRWLILTDNKIATLPKSIGACKRLQKCMLAGNLLQELPEEMQNCKKLGLLRLSSNRLRRLPPWLFDMPELAFLSFAGNPCSEALEASARAPLASVPWSSLQISNVLGQGASGVISRAVWQSQSGSVDVAVKIFKGSLTSDGAPVDEMAAVMVAGQHSNIIDCLGRVEGHPDAASGEFKGGLVMQLIPPEYRVLGLSPSMASCTRDCYPDEFSLFPQAGINILSGIASAAHHLTSHGISHGDLYAHNILYNTAGHAFLGDFGAATVHTASLSAEAPRLEKLEVLAYGHLVEDILTLIDKSPASFEKESVIASLRHLHEKCTQARAQDRPTFVEIIEKIAQLQT